MKRSEVVVSPDGEKERNAICPACSKEFQPKRSSARFCSSACRQSAFRKSPAGKEARQRQGQRMKVRRASRRAEHFVRVNRDRHFAFDGRFSGPIVAGVPSLGSLTLPSYAEATNV
jgi:hypothetical protein